MKLTVERLFSDPPLTGSVPAAGQFSPDGRRAAFLRTAEDDRERQDLWRLDCGNGDLACWLDARQIDDQGSSPTAAEKAERERRRQFQGGISGFAFSPGGDKVLVTAAGAGYLMDTANGRVDRFTPAGTRQTDLRFSPDGRHITYVRDGNLLCWDLAASSERAITNDGGGTVSYGAAEFIAQEEMHRFDGYWWSPDGTRIAYTRVDESPIPVTNRLEIDADQIRTVEQRYPFAGGANAAVALLVMDWASGAVTEISYLQTPSDYLARVNWAGSELAVQTQSRDQRELRLRFFDPVSGNSRDGLEERSATWINLHDNFRYLEGERFLWTSERDGHSHLYLCDGSRELPLTRGEGRVNRVLHADEHRILFTGWFGNPQEQHLYSVSASAASGPEEPVRLTAEPGWHEVTVDLRGEQFLDRFSAVDRQPSCRVRKLEGPQVNTIGQELADGLSNYAPYLTHHVTPQLGTVVCEDGQTLHYRLTRPSNGSRQKSPVIVHVYGGPGVQRVRNEWAPALLQLFVQHGFGVFELDNRGSGNRDRGFEEPIHRQLGKVEVADQVLGADFLRSLDWVDPERIGVFGHSYGGYMTIMCLAQAPASFKAGVSVAPVTDWHLYDTHYTERYLGHPEDNASGYGASSVFPHLDGIKGRLLLIHGMADDNVLYTNSTMLYRALQARHFPFEMMAYPGSKHSLQERDVSIHRFNLILDFFERAL
jgi:dipeptidyl-peptidase-4